MAVSFSTEAAFDWDRARSGRHEIGTDKPCVYTKPGGFSTDRIHYLAPNGSTYEGDPISHMEPYRFSFEPVSYKQGESVP